MAQAKDKTKNKDVKKEKGKKGKDKKGKDKSEEADLPTSGGVSNSYVATFTLGAGALLLGGVLLARRLFQRTAPTGPPDENREGTDLKDGDERARRIHAARRPSGDDLLTNSPYARTKFSTGQP